MTATVRDLRDRNKASVLRWVLRDGETTRGRLASACGLSAATVTNVVTDLVRDGLLQEAGSIPSEGGRPRARISVVPTGLHLIGAQVGEDGVTAELFDLSLERVARSFQPLDPRSANPQ